ncbi:unnamed protein product [Prunus armeniaca]|uniref:Protein LAZY 1-like n=1 Tax=Prunus armeniaca TaxID=36596 RepID=A0A6J5WZH4_PRUAR|nr:unnamed protein product [Prunus armeniaca]
MKFLQWVHHKFRHGSIEPLKDLSIGDPGIFLSAQPSVDDQHSYMKSSFGSSYGSTSLEPPKRDQEKSFSESEANREEETSAIISELFHGFLTIGTLGSEPSINEPETPTFATTLENLKKFLEVETKEEGVLASSARNSHASTITLNGKQMEESEDEEYWTTTVVCPLKEYLFGSSIELTDTRIEAKKEKTSLQELFDRTKMTTENCKQTSESVDIKSEHKHTSAMQFMKKIIKKLHASSKSSAPCTGGDVTDPVSTRKKFGEASDSVSTKKKPHKILRMFHRRIHPESSTAAREFVDAEKYKDKNNSSAHGDCRENMMLMGRDNRRFPQGAMIKEGTEHCKKYMNLPQYRLSGSNFRRKGEHWIKTDADCKYHFISYTMEYFD